MSDLKAMLQALRLRFEAKRLSALSRLAISCLCGAESEDLMPLMRPRPVATSLEVERGVRTWAQAIEARSGMRHLKLNVDMALPCIVKHPGHFDFAMCHSTQDNYALALAMVLLKPPKQMSHSRPSRRLVAPK